MKKLQLFIIALIISAACQAQTKDTVIYKHDTIPIISVADMNAFVIFLEDKVTKKEYDLFFRAYQLLLQSVESKRKLSLTTKNK